MPFYGFAYPTRMVVIRLQDGSLFVWSPTALSSDLTQEVDALGTVRHLVSPNLLHHLFLSEWKSAYPYARLYASPGLRRRRKLLPFDADLCDTPDLAWAMDMDQVLVRGSFFLTEAVFFHHPSHTAIFADLIQNFPLRLVQGLARPRRAAWWNRRTSSRRTARSADVLPKPSCGTCLAPAHSGLADRAGVDGSRRTGHLGRSGLRARCLQMAAHTTALI